MTKLLLLFTLLSAFTSFSQSSELILTKALKNNPEYYIKYVEVADKIDDATYFFTAQIQKKQVVYMMNFRVTHNAETNVYTAEKLDVSHNEVYKNLKSRFFKFEGEIYRLRIDRDKKQTLFYADRFKGSSFEKQETPFYKDDKEYTGREIIYKTKKTFIVVTRPYGYEKVKMFTAQEFDADFKLISSNTFTAQEELKISDDNIQLLDDQVVLSYQYEKEDKTAGIGIWTNNENSEIPIEKPENLVDVNIWSEEGNLIFFLLTKKDDVLGYQLLAFDLQTKSSETISELDNFFDLEYPDTKNLVSSYLKKDTDGSVYMVYTLATISREHGILAAENLLALRFKEGEVLWSQLVTRSKRSAGNVLIPSAKLTETDLQINDYEPKTAFNDGGRHTPENPDKKSAKEIIVGVEYVPMRIELDKNTGEITRTVMND